MTTARTVACAAALAALLAITFTPVTAQSATCALNPTYNYSDVFPYNWVPPTSTVFQCPTEGGWVSRGPNCFKFYPTALSWSDASVACMSKGAVLAEIDLFSNNLFVGNLVTTTAPTVTGYWIGLTRTGSASTYDGFWSDGSSVDLVVGNWAAGQPAGASGTCAWIANNAASQYPWALDACNVKRPFVCQTDACISGQFLCFNGNCVNGQYVCDGANDCGDMSDEMNCPALCTQTVSGTASSGTIQSANYPSAYPASSNCLWLLQGPLGTNMQLTFTAFTTETNIDVVDIYVGGSTLVTSQYASSISGTQTAASLPTYVSNNHLMIVRFTADSTVQKTGFQANWKTTFTCNMGSLPGYGYPADQSPISKLTSTTEANCQTTCLANVNCASFTFVIGTATCNLHGQVWPPVKAAAYNYWVKTCPGTAGTSEMQGLPGVGNVLTATSTVKAVFSPGYPLPYFTNLRVFWVIQASTVWSLVTIQAMDVSLGPGDSVEVHDGSTSVGTILQRYVTDGSTNVKFITTTQQFMYIYMSTVSTQRGRGFYFNYFVGCTYTMTATTGTIQSPGYGVTNYPPLANCMWKISIPTPSAGIGVTLTFTSAFNVASLDKLTIYTDAGPTFTVTSTPAVTGFNGQTAPANVYAATGIILVTFTSDASGGAPGFFATFSQDCPVPKLDNNTQATPVPIPLTYLSQFSATCNTGYHFLQEEFGQCPVTQVGASVTLTCLAGGAWSGLRLPTCSLVQCGAPPVVENGLILNVTSLYFGGIAYYGCQGGFMFGDSTNTQATCQETGVWTTPSVCQGIQCPAFNIPANGAVNVLYGDGISYTSVLQVVCNTGYELTAGFPIAFCRMDQTWSYSIQPVCSILSCIVPMVTNGVVTSNGGTVTTVQYGTPVLITCNTGYQLLGSATVTCNELGQFPGLSSCLNINECLNSPCTGGGTCFDTQGSFYCMCGPGYTLDSSLTNCADIDECATNNGYCDNQCQNSPGSFSCSCTDTGAILYSANGTSGFNIMGGETGLDNWDILRLNRSCVPIACPIPTIQFGSTVSDAAPLLYSAAGTMLLAICNIGYVLGDGSQESSLELECQSDGTWNPPPPTCINATCPALVLPSTLVNPPTNINPQTPVNYNQAVTWQCNVPGSQPQTFTGKQTCLYDVNHEIYNLTGSGLDCGVIDCGFPAGVAGMDTSLLNSMSTVYNSTFTFQCLQGFTLNGTSPTGDLTVRCVADPRARWDYGTLVCAGPSCTDPGTPPDGFQTAQTYEAGKVVTFGCRRPGFMPNPPSVTCTQASDLTMQWSPPIAATGPTCMDVTAPVFTGCTAYGVAAFVNLYDPVSSVVPVVTDNSRLVASLTTTSVPDLASPIAASQIITWTATDAVGNSATCNSNVTVRVQVAPNITCPVSTYVYLTSGVSVITQAINATPAIPYGTATITRNIIVPPSVTIGVAQLWQTQQFTQIATDNFGNQATCNFQLVVAPGQCSSFALKTPGNGGSKICTNATADYGRCLVSCPSGFVLYNLHNPSYFVCSATSPTYALETDPTVTYVPDCIPTNSSTYQQNYQIYYTTGSAAPFQVTAPYLTVIQGLLSGVQSTLQGLCNAQLASPPTVLLNQTLVADTVINYLRVTYSIKIVSASQTAGVTQCGQLIMNAFTDLANAQLTYTGAAPLKTITMPASSGLANIFVLVTGNSVPSMSSVQILLNNYSCPVGLGLQSDNGFYYCVSCAPGMQKVGEFCTPCPVGTYQNLQGQTSCIACPSNMSTYTIGSSASTQCIAMCAPGFMSSTGLPPCTQCSTSSYWSSPTSCTACPTGTFTTHPGAYTFNPNVTLCMSPCALGFYSPTGLMPCTACPIGYYQNEVGQTTCEQCPLGDTTSAIGATDPTMCTVGSSLCSSNPCLNGGTCNVNSGSSSLSCSCPTGFTGIYCQTYIDPCASRPCYHNGTCASNSSMPGTYTCTCPPVTQNNYTETPNSFVSTTQNVVGYQQSASLSTLDCQNLCSANALCAYAVFSFQSLACYLYASAGATVVTSNVQSSTFTRVIFVASIYSGNQCQIAPNNCASSQCKNQANCQNVQQAGAYNCLCLQNSPLGLFNGTLCDKSVDVCASNPCQNKGTCVKLNSIRYKCTCAPGYTGYNCQTNINECSSNPCLYGGTCTDMVNAFNCSCPLGYSGPTCATRPASICAVYNQPCGTNGRCVDYYPASSYLCACNTGFTSELYWTRWLSIQSNVTSFGDMETLTLFRNASIAICPEDPNGPVSARFRVKGTQTVFYGLNDAPQALQEADNLGLVCANSDQQPAGTLCFTYEVQFQCDAMGLKCYFENDCSVNPCQNGGSCTPQVNGYTCQCVPGYNGVNCQHLIDYCQSNPCMYGGVCNTNINKYQCNCQPGFGGNNCQTIPNNCLSNACNATGTAACNSSLTGYTCQCKPGYTGIYCDTIIDNCFSFPCHHGGTCANSVNSYKCTCPTGYTGTTCANLTMSLCQANTCVNGGLCVDGVTDYLCRCNANFYGRTCSQGQGVCQIANPCLNGGACTNSLSGASCTCSQNYGNPANCECQRNFCSPTNNICQNGATCSILPSGSFQCACPPGYTGATCASMINNCAGVNCGSGTCINGILTYYCACPVGFVGDACSKAISRNVDVCLSTSHGVNSLYPYLLNVNSFSIGFWVLYSNLNGQGEVITVYSTASQSSVVPVKPLLTFNATTVIVTTSDGLNQYLSYAQPINDGVWHYVTFTFSTAGGQSQAIVYVDTITNALATSPYFGNAYFAQSNYALIHIGASLTTAPQYFQGCVSLIQVWNTLLTSAQMTTVISATNKDVSASWYLTGLLWDYGYGLYTAGDHVMEVVPSSRGLRVCPVGQSSVINSNGQNVCSGPDKSSPYLNMCPDDVSSPVTSEGYALLSWTAPTFSGATSVISNFVSDTTFPIGVDPVMYVAKNAALNYNECTFRALASLGTCSGLQAPNGASAPVCSQGVGDGELYTRCTVSCSTGMAFLRPLPNFLDCWEAGVWNTYNPYVDLQLPPCGTLGTVHKHIVFGFTYNLVSAFTPAVGATIQTALQAALSNWNQILTSAGAGVCTDSTCANTNVIVFNSNGQAGVTITLDQSPLTVGSGVSVKTAVVQATLVDQRFVANVPGANSVDPTTFTMTDTTQCVDANTQPTGDQCVQCPPGTYFNSTALLCYNCAVGSYQDQPMQSQCISCGTGMTTQKDGSDSLSDCFTSCNPGNYYDFTAQSCLPCPQAQYQTCSGRSYCQRCPSGKTTSSSGASSPASCFNDCQSGYQLMSNGSCAICAVGTYRLQGFQSNCTQCPDGYTTLQTGSIHVTDCNTVVCPPGQFRAGVNPGTCNPCPIGFYRNASQANCTSCGDPSMWRTSDVGATDYSFCQFYCPAGQYISSTNKCSTCPQSSYKDLSVDSNYYATSCTQCSPPFPVTASTGATSSAACLYPACTAGQVVDSNDNTQCDNCPFNTYQPNPVPTTDTCINCPPNTGTPTDGTANATQCSILCPSGQEMNTTTLKCQPCARAFWKDNTISQAASFSPCQPCPSGTITPSTGATSDSQCTQADCQPGSNIDSIDNTQCDQCVVGTYQTMKWQTSCLQCPPGSTTVYAGSVFLSDCSVMTNTRVFLIKFSVLLPFISDYFFPTSANFIQFKTQIEYMMTNLLKLKIRSFRGTAQVKAFTPGSIVIGMQAQFNNSDLMVSSSLSSTLQAAFSSGLFSDPTGQYSALPVSSSAYSLVYIGPSDAVTVCSGGQDVNFQTGVCESCAVGSYQLSWMTQICATCPAGYSTLQAGTVGDQTSCLLVCGAGKESRDGTTCQACLPNFYKTASGPANCTACNSGLITVVTGATSASQCQAACPSGQFSDNSGATPVCQSCPQGTYQNMTNQLSCISCPQFYNTAGQGASDVSACQDVCSLDSSYCQNSGKCTFDVNAKQATCACTIIFTGDRCGSISWVLYVIIVACVVVVVLIIVIIVVCVRRRRGHKGEKDQKKLQQQLQNLQLQNAIQNQQNMLNPQQKSVLKSKPPTMMYDESNLAGVVPQQHVSFYNPTYRNDQGAAMNTLYGMSPGYAPSLSLSSGFLFHEDADDTRLHPAQRTSTSGAFYQAS